jgi:hypothetical protein
MAADYLELLTRRDTLLALGTCLVVIGIVLRGFARSSRRDRALRKQQMLDDPEPVLPPEPFSLWLENNIGRIAGIAIVAGILITIAGFWRK